MRRWLGIFALAQLGSLVAAASCGDPSHVFEGRLFVEDRACLGTTSSVDVVEGTRPGECPPACLAQPLRNGGRAIYVATMCGPFPFAFDASANDPLCPTALAALERNDACLLDGGSSNPVPVPADASAD